MLQHCDHVAAYYWFRHQTRSDVLNHENYHTCARYDILCGLLGGGDLQ